MDKKSDDERVEWLILKATEAVIEEKIISLLDKRSKRPLSSQPQKGKSE